MIALVAPRGAGEEGLGVIQQAHLRLALGLLGLRSKRKVTNTNVGGL